MKKNKKELDSLFGLYTIMKDKETKAAIELQSQISFGNKTLQDLQNKYTNEVPKQIWSRINAYPKDYGKQKGFEIIFGISGNGNIMYANETNMDITNELIMYMNTQYEGKSLNL